MTNIFLGILAASTFFLFLLILCVITTVHKEKRENRRIRELLLKYIDTNSEQMRRLGKEVIQLAGGVEGKIKDEISKRLQ
jgi:signal transduction histidine kinase